MDKRLYMPIIKWKSGEQTALANIKDETKDFIIPLIEIMDIPDTRKKTPTIEQYLDEIVDDISDSWGTDDPLFIDFHDLDESSVTSDEKHFLYYLYEKLLNEEIKAIPVYSFDRCKSFQNAVIDINNTYKTGICLRITTDYIDRINDLIVSLLHENPSLTANNISLVIDFDFFAPNQINTNLLALTAAINSIPKITEFKFFSICGTGFPDSISNIESRSIGEIDRSEWILWKKVMAKSSIPRKPVFGDYNITHPKISDFDPVIMKIAGKIKYTFEDKFIIFKGSSLKKDGSEQMHSLSNSLTTNQAFMGEEFSWGDKYISKCSRREASPGNPKTWVSVAINHHLEYVVYQLANQNDV